MAENDVPVTGTETPGPVTPAPVADNRPADAASQEIKPTINWQERYGKTQDSLNALYKRTGFQKLDDIPSADVWQGWRTAADQLKGVQEQHTQLAADHEIQASELSGLRAQETKLRLLAEKYPQLGRFHSNIPTMDTPEEQEGAIQAFQASLQGYMGALVQGAPPPPAGGIPAGGSATLEDEVKSAWAEYERATMEMKPRAEIQRLFDKYNALDARYRKEKGIADKYAAPRARLVE